MLAYGKNVLLMTEPKKIKKVYLSKTRRDEEVMSFLKNHKIHFVLSDNMVLNKMVSGNHQGIVFEMDDFEYQSISTLYEDSFVVLLDHLEDPHNFGAIIRTCEAAGIHSIIIPKDRQVQVNSTVMKTSAGTLDSMNIVSVSNIVNSLEQLKKAGYWIVGTALENSVDYREVDYSGKIAIIIGNEGSGISQLVSRNCDFLVKIPMYGTTNSLNASVAAGIMIYEVIRNRK